MLRYTKQVECNFNVEVFRCPHCGNGTCVAVNGMVRNLPDRLRLLVASC